MTFNRDASWIKKSYLPISTIWNNSSWLEDGIFIHTFVKDGEEKGNHYYFYNIESDSFEDIKSIKGSLSDKTTPQEERLSSSPDGKLLTFTYCIKTGFKNNSIDPQCERWGVSTITKNGITEIFKKNTNFDPIYIGWYKDNILIKQGEYPNKDTRIQVIGNTANKISYLENILYYARITDLLK